MMLLTLPLRAAMRASAAAAFCCLAATAAQAQSVYFSGPSVARADTVASFEGGNFKANLPVNVVVSAPNGTESAYGAVVGANGKLRFEMVPNQKGAYSIAVTGTDGKPLAKTTLIANP